MLLNLLVGIKSSFNDVCDIRIKKCERVSASRSQGSDDRGVKGREFRIDSIWVRAVKQSLFARFVSNSF